MKRVIVLLWMLAFLFAAHAARAADDYGELVKTNLEMRQRMDALETKYTSLEGERDVLIGRVKELQRDNDALSKQASGKGGGISQAELSDIKKKLDDASKTLAAVAKDRDTLKKQLDDTQKSLQGVDKRILDEVQKRVKNVQVEKTEAYKVLQKQNADFQIEIQKLKEALDKAKKSPPQPQSKAKPAGTADPEKQVKTKGQQSMDISQAEILSIQLDKLEGDLRAAKNNEKKEKDAAEMRVKQLKALTDKEREDMHFNLAVVYEQNKMYGDAEREYYKCLELDPLDADVQYNLGILYDDKMNKSSAALVHYKRYLELRPKGESSEEVRQWIFNAEQETRLGVEAK